MKSIAFARKLITFDMKSNGKYKTLTRNQREIARKSITFDKKSVAFDTKLKRLIQKIDEKSIGSRWGMNQ